MIQVAFKENLHKVFRFAIIANKEEAVESYIKRGENINGRDKNGLTPLMLAVDWNRFSICQLILESGCELTLLDQNGNDAWLRALEAEKQGFADLISSYTNTIDIDTTDDSSEVMLDSSQDIVGVAGYSMPTLVNEAYQGSSEDDELDWEVAGEGRMLDTDESLLNAVSNVHDGISHYSSNDDRDEWFLFDNEIDSFTEVSIQSNTSDAVAKGYVR